MHIVRDIDIVQEPISNKLKEYYGECLVTHVYLNNQLLTNFAQEVERKEDTYITMVYTPWPCFEPFDCVLRRSGKLVMILPVFDYDRSERLGKSLNVSYPPALRDGALFMTQEQFEQVRFAIPAFQKFNDIPYLTKKDVAHLIWFEAPDLDAFGDDTQLADDFKQKWYLNTDAPEGDEVVDILQDMLREYANSDDSVMLDRARVGITIILDTPEYDEWKPLYRAADGYYLRIEPGYVVVPINNGYRCSE